MLIPIRCFSCGKPLGEEYEKYKELVKEGKKPIEALKEIGIKRYCCKRMLFTQVDTAEQVIQYEKY
ncbi:MAG: DNA-directed RNA polymerase subunit N [Candidatus Diapherotrites archaeon]|nr:DNA-directed RNA polymerase subunit N [Candidatus Diapherotrites archaeon]